MDVIRFIPKQSASTKPADQGNFRPIALTTCTKACCCIEMLESEVDQTIADVWGGAWNREKGYRVFCLKSEMPIIPIYYSSWNPGHLSPPRQTYQHALTDLETIGMISKIVTIEIGALGLLVPHTHFSLQQLVSTLSKSAPSHLLDSAAESNITASQRIFCALFNPSWNSSRLSC